MARKLLRYGGVTELDPLQLAGVCGAGNDRETVKAIKKRLDAASPSQFEKWDACMMKYQPKDVDSDKTPPGAWKVLFNCSREHLGWK